MGDRFCLKIACVFCGTVNNVYYAPTCEMYDFTCSNKDLRIEKVDIATKKVIETSKSLGPCNTINFICADFRVKKVEDVTEEDVVQAFEMATTGNHTLASIRKEAKRYLRGLKKRAKK